MLAVEYDAIVGAEVAQLTRLGAGGRDLGKADRLEDLAQIGRRVDVGGVHVRADVAAHHLFAATPAGDDADAHFDQAHIGLGVGDDAVGGQADLAAAAQRHLVRRSHDRSRRRAEAHERVLAKLDHHLQFVPHVALHGQHHGKDVGADGEVLAVIGNDQAGGVAVQPLNRLLHDVEHGAVERIDARVPLQQHDAVANVPQAGHFVAGELLARAADVLHAQRLGAARHLDVFLARRVVDHLLVAGVGEEALVAGGQHRLDPRRHADAFAFQAGNGCLDAQSIPRLERAHLPGKAPLHRVIDVDQAVGDLGHALGGVGHGARERVPDQLARLVVGLDQRLEAIRQRQVARIADAAPARLAGRHVLQRAILSSDLQVESPEGLLALLVDDGLVEALPALGAEQLVLNEQLHHRAAIFAAQNLAILVVRDQVVEVAADQRHHVDADDVVEAEGAGLGAAQQRPGQRIDGLYAVAVLDGEFHDVALQEADHAVGDKVRRVLADDDALAQHILGKVLHAVDDCPIGVGRGDDLEQVQVARRVEEVRAEEARLELRRAPLGDDIDRDAGGVAADDGIRAGDLLDALHELLLRLRALHDYLDHPVAATDRGVEVILEVAHGDEAGGALREKVGRLGLDHAVVAGLDDAIAHLAIGEGQPGGALLGGQFGRDNVEQPRADTGVSQVSGNGGPHRPRADDGDGFDSVWHANMLLAGSNGITRETIQLTLGFPPRLVCHPSVAASL